MDPPTMGSSSADDSTSENSSNEDEDMDESVDKGQRKPPAKEDSNIKAAPRKRKRDGKPEKTNHNTRWQMMFDRLVAYKQKHGDTNVPNRYPEDPQLGSWVSAQRRAYKTVTSGNSDSSAMTLERANKLKQLGFEWEALNPNSVPWEVRYGELLAFVKKYGHPNVPMRWKENVQLSNWVSKQRHDFKLLQRGTSHRLTEERMKLLNDLNFVWEVERGSSVAKLQRVAVVGLRNRKSGNTTKSPAKVAKPEESTTAQAQPATASRSSAVDPPGRTTKSPAAETTERDVQWWAASHGSRMGGRPFASVPLHVAAPPPWASALSATRMGISTAGTQATATGILRGRTARNDDNLAQDDGSNASGANNDRLAQQEYPLRKVALTQQQRQQLLDSEALLSLHHGNPGTSMAHLGTTSPSHLLAALHPQHRQTGMPPMTSLMPPSHHSDLLGIGQPGMQSSLSLATLQALQRQRDDVIASILSGSATYNPTNLPSGLFGDVSSSAQRGVLLSTPTSSLPRVSTNALSAALGGHPESLLAGSYRPPALSWLPPGIGSLRQSSNVGGFSDPHTLVEASRLYLANQMTNAAGRSDGASAAVDPPSNSPPSGGGRR